MKVIHITGFILSSLILLVILINIVINIDFSIKEKNQYELICQTIDENREYYIEFSNEFISVFDKNHPTPEEKSRYGEIYPLLVVYDELKNELNTNLVGYDCRLIKREVGSSDIKYVEIEYPYSIESFDFLLRFKTKFQIAYFVIYIPDKFMSPSILTNILGEDYHSLYRNDNLFVVKRYYQYI
jgi:hypothetical protein